MPEITYFSQNADFTLITHHCIFFYNLGQKTVSCIRSFEPGESYIAQYQTVEEMERDAIEQMKADRGWDLDGELTLFARCECCGEWFMKRDMESEAVGPPGMTLESWYCNACRRD